MKIGIISLLGRSAKEIAKYCEEYFDQVDLLDIRKFEVQVNGGLNVFYNQEKLPKYDCIYIRGSHKYALIARSITRALSHESYIPVKHNAYTIGHDKFMTLLELQKKEIPIPRTHYAATTIIAKQILKDVSYPVIMKLSEGTHGRGVMIADSKKSAMTILDLLEAFHKPYLIQEFVTTNGTSDIRAVIFKEKVLASYKRVAMEGEIRANVHSGGSREVHELTEEEKELAINSAKAIGADLCGVDILNAETPSVIEINLSPATQGIEEVCGENISKKIAKELYLQTKLFKKKRKKKEKEKQKKKEKQGNKTN